MKNSWKVRYSGKLDISIFSYIVILLAYLYFVLRGTQSEGGELSENLWMGVIILFPFLIAAVTLPSSLLKKKKIPRSIEIDSDAGTIAIEFFKKDSPCQFELKDLSYQKIESTFFTILVLYKKEIATRGHTLDFELFSMFALDISTSWNKKMLYEIVNRLKELNIAEHFPQKKKPIIDYIFE